VYFIYAQTFDRSRWNKKLHFVGKQKRAHFVHIWLKPFPMCLRVRENDLCFFKTNAFSSCGVESVGNANTFYEFLHCISTFSSVKHGALICQKFLKKIRASN